MIQFNASIAIVMTECWVCGCFFGVQEVLLARAKDQGSSVNFFCPNGHSLTFGEGTRARLEKELEEVRQERTRCRLGWESAARENERLLAKLDKKKKK